MWRPLYVSDTLPLSALSLSHSHICCGLFVHSPSITFNEVLLEPIRNEKLLSKNDVSAIFSNIENILTVNLQLLKVHCYGRKLS